MEKIAGSLVGFCLKATLCGVGGYVLGGLASKSLSENDLKAEQTFIRLLHYVDKSENTVEKYEKDKLKMDEIDPSRTSL